MKSLVFLAVLLGVGVVLSNAFNKSALSSQEAKADLAVAMCPDCIHYCDDGQTCCKGADGIFRCCAFPNAMCCADGSGCCPEGFTCWQSQCLPNQPHA